MRRLLIPLLATIALCAQEPSAQQRRTVPGRLVGPDGEPVAEATVTAIWTHVAGPSLVPRDVVQTTSDASGRFRLELWPTLAYSVFAVGPARDDGTRVATRSTRGFVGGVVELRGARIAAAVRVQFEGLDAWRERGPFSVRGHLSRRGVGTFELALDDDDGITLPPAPRDGVLLDVIDAHGRALLHTKDWLREPLRTVRIAPPLAVQAIARDPDGAPVAGARIGWQCGSEQSGAPDGLTSRPVVLDWIEVGVSDNDGRARLQLPFTDHPLTGSGTSLFTATHPAHSGANGGQLMQRIAIDERTDDAPDVLHFALGAPAPCVVRVHDGGRARPGVRCALAARWWVSRNQRAQDFERQFYGETDAAGECRFAGVPPGAGSLRLMLAIPNDDGPPILLPTVELAADGPTDIDLAELVTTHVTVRAADGTPAQGAALVVLPLDSAPPDEWVEPRHCDAGGRAVVRAFGSTLLFVFNDREYGELVLEADRTELQLQPMCRMQLRIVDEHGAPVAGAMMTMQSSTSGRSSDTPEEKHRRRLVSQLNHWLRDRHRADDEGRIVLPFVPPPPGDYTVQAWKHEVGSSPAIPLQATEGTVELVLR